MLWQAVPAFAFGLYTAIGSKAVLLGTSVGAVVDFILIGVIFADEGAADPLPTVDKSWSTFVAVILNVAVTVIAHYASKADDVETDETDGDRLSFEKLRAIMDGVSEPVTKWYGALVWLSLAITIWTGFHWIGDVDPELDGVDGLIYDGKVRNVIAGLPDYIFATLLWYVVAVVVGVAATMTWDVDVAGATKKDKENVAGMSPGSPTEMEME